MTATDTTRDERGDRAYTVVVGLAIVAVMLLVYVGSNVERTNLYNHFVWQASAWLDGQASIPYPVIAENGVGPANDYFNDVEEIVDADGIPTGRGMLPFPPLPAVVLLPSSRSSDWPRTSSSSPRSSERSTSDSPSGCSAGSVSASASGLS